ncbi:UDP-N-acetylmuramate dehydrogenase [Arhodomonas aquaeolei]|uniref:UDP-N-acetylmuramate dehydrogenase n=1 Tax=Arhodomonas aquaeolei TaxID=2369 RepID=UPI000376F46A|nr:UDP-N-acetylmuramate dehydrogenase [Arhodomonas aquaeolei]
MTRTAGQLLHDEPMARHTSWRVGGPAEWLYRPADADDLCRFLAALPADTPVHWVGLGSNLLVRDGGLPGVVIQAGRGLAGLDVEASGEVTAGAGVPCAKLARACGRAGLVGAEFFAGIPGMLGGALTMNAGAWGGETWAHVLEVETVDHAGGRRWRACSEFEIGYRSVAGPTGEWFLGARLAFAPGGDNAALADRVRELLAERAARQPMGQASCGSVFRNPPGDHAARLIEAAGLKGHAIGGARVSDKHANFIINTGEATAADIETLIGHVAACVRERFGVSLQPEVRIIGEEARHD